MIRWKKANFGRWRATVAVINPSWLSVERAIIFFRSISTLAAVLDMSIVVVPTRRRKAITRGQWE